MDATSNLSPPVQERLRRQWIPSLLLSPGLRLVCLRLIILATLIQVGVTIWVTAQYGIPLNRRNVVALAFILIVVIHHIGTAFGPLLFPLPVWTDTGLMVVETGWYLFLFANWAVYGSDHLSAKDFVQASNVLGVFYVWVLPFCFPVLLILKVLAIVNTWGTSPMRKRVNISARGTVGPWWRYPIHTFFGTRLWEARVPGEPKTLSILRGLLALLAIFSLMAFGWYKAVISPISGMERLVHRHLRAVDLPSKSFDNLLQNATGTFTLVWEVHPNATSDIVHATTANARSGSARTPCSVDEVYGWTSLRLGPQYGAANISCPFSPFTYNITRFSNVDLSINFTGLLGTSDRSSTRMDFDAVRVYVGLTPDRDLEVVFRNTDPISLFPGTNMLAVIRPVFRQRIQRAGLATLGLQSLNTFMVAVVEQITSNPFMDPPSNPNISTLGLTFQTVVNEWTCVQEYNADSVLAGLSTIGGLGSFLSTLLVMLVGTSLLTAFFRAKPHSPFGILHGTSYFQRRMADACDEKYTALREVLRRENDNPGALAFLLDTMIDLDDLRAHALKPATSEAQCNERGGDEAEQLLEETATEPKISETEREAP